MTTFVDSHGSGLNSDRADIFVDGTCAPFPADSPLHHFHTKALLDRCSGALTLHHPNTQDHSVRVASYALRLAIALGWTTADCEHVWLAARLHDIGKIYITPSAILDKDGPLSSVERVFVHRHPGLGANLVINQVPYDVYHGIHDHHERFDGNTDHKHFPGYPSGKKEAGIHPIGRCLAICDSYDAMTTNRPRSPRVSKEAAVLQLKYEAGLMYDPFMVDAFVNQVAPAVQQPSRATRFDALAIPVH